jgi:hypothetical protein
VWTYDGVKNISISRCLYEIVKVKNQVLREDPNGSFGSLAGILPYREKLERSQGEEIFSFFPEGAG